MWCSIVNDSMVQYNILEEAFTIFLDIKKSKRMGVIVKARKINFFSKINTPSTTNQKAVMA